VTVLDEASYRALLDSRGVLRPRALAPPDPGVAFTVFAQRTDAAVDVAALSGHARRFFAARLGLTIDKRYDADLPSVDAARVVLATDDGEANGTRLCYGRPAEATDHAAAGRP